MKGVILMTIPYTVWQIIVNWKCTN